MPAELQALRDQIDTVDRKILALVMERVQLVLQVGEIKRQQGLAIYDPKRERLILDQLAALAQPPVDAATVRRIFERLIDEARHLEQRHVGNASEPPGSATGP